MVLSYKILRDTVQPGFEITWNAAVRCFEVRSEVFRTRFGAYKRRIGDAELAHRTPGARHVQLVNDVRRTTDVTEVTSHAASELHPAELRMLH